MSSYEMPHFEVADIFHQFGHLLGRMPRDHWKVVQAIKNCRTSVLGGHRLRCKGCEFTQDSYNSCRNRHCPKCQFTSRMKWVEKRTDELLPCQYFHVVFTLPRELSSLIQCNKKLCYDLLFKAASQTLKEVAANPKNLGADIGFIGVLHTWSQTLMDHPHIHFIVPGGGLSKDGRKWIECKKNYFLPVKILSTVFRGKMLSLIEKSFNKFEFPGIIEALKSESEFKALLRKAASKDWVVYSKETFAGPEQVINYLGQYTHRIAISNYRLIKLEGEMVHFKYRDPDDPKKKKVMVLHVKEFMRRFLLHVLPQGYMRIRHFGILGNRFKKAKIALIRYLKGVKDKAQQHISDCWKELVKKWTPIDPDLCPKCKATGLVHTKTFRSILSSG